MFRNKKNRRKSDKRESVDYSNLEQRCLLAVTPTLSGGVLDIAMTEAMDQLILGSSNDLEVLVNGEMIDSDLKTDGIQAATIADVTDIQIVGNKGLDDLFVQLSSFFADGTLDSLSMSNINTVQLEGNYSMDSFDGMFVGEGGSMFGSGQITVGNLQINSSSNFAVDLANPENDFTGPISIVTDADVQLSDVNDVLLQDLDVNNLTVTSGGTITDAKASFLIAERTTFFGLGIDLGFNGNAVNFDTVEALTPGQLAINDVDSLSIAGFTNVGSATIQVNDTLGQGPQSNVDVNGDAVFSGRVVRLGVGGGNQFQTGRINLNVTENAFVWQNNSMELFGANAGPAFDLFAVGDITNSDNAVINVDGITSVQSTANVSLGTANDDQFNSTSFEFFAPSVTLSEDSSTSITGFANFAGDLMIDSNGSITNGDGAYIVVENNAFFISVAEDGQQPANVNLGTSENDFFIAGTVSFNVANGSFILSEDDTIFLAFKNSANAMSLASTGDIVNGPQSVVEVATTATFSAVNVDIGESGEDTVNFGSVNFNVDDFVFVQENSDILLTGDSNIGGQIILITAGTITDSNTSDLEVANLTTLFAGAGITVGDSADDSFVTGLLRFGSANDVDVTHNGDIMLAPGLDSDGLNVTLTAAGGGIFGQAGTVLQITGDLVLAATADIVIGASENDSVVFDDLNFNTVGNVTVETDFESAEEEVFIFGANTANEFRFTTNVDVRDGTNARTTVDSFIRIEARNITLGDSDTDCLSLPEVGNQEFLTSDQAASITEDEGDC